MTSPGASGASGYPTYTENPYTGGPDEVVPEGGLSSTGIADLADKTQQDWQEELFGPLNTTLDPLSELFSKVTQTFIDIAEKIVGVFSEFVDLDNAIAVLNDVLTFFYDLLDRAGFFELLSGGVDLFGWLVELGADAIEAIIKPIVEFLAWVWDLIGPTLQDLIQDVIDFLSPILDPTRFVELFNALVNILVNVFDGLNLSGIVTLITNIFSWLIRFFLNVVDAGSATFSQLFTALQTFLLKVPLIGDLLGLAGADRAKFNLTSLPDLINWFQTRVLTKDSKIPADNLVGTIPKKLLGSLGVGNIDPSTPSLVDLAGFPDASVMQEGGRWSFDGAVSRSVGSGSAKVTCNSAAARLYSNKIPVSATQLLSLSAWVKWTGLSNNNNLSSPISVGVRTYNSSGQVVTSFTQVAAVPALAGVPAASTSFPGNDNGWVQVANLLAFTVPAGVTSVRMVMGVTQSATAGTVWFDDGALRKTNNLATNLVSGIFGNTLDEDLTTLDSTASTAAENADGAFEAAGAAQDAADSTNNVLFGTTAPSVGQLLLKEVMPLNDIGAALTTAGSGAQLVRKNENNFNVAGNIGGIRAAVPTGFWDTKTRGSSDIITSSSGGYYTGSFQVTLAGWYLVEIGYRIKPSFVAVGYQVAPVLFKNGSVFRIGTDATSGLPGQRYVQSGWIVYLDPNEYVQAGYDGAGFTGGLIDADSAGLETYFSIALLNRSYE